MQTDPFLISNSILSLKYLRSTTICCKVIEIRKSEIEVKTQLLGVKNINLEPQ